MEASYKYKAFISYRHKIPDKAVAVKLQKKLEGYRPPKSVAVKGFKKWRLFRDVTELQASSDLGEKIKDALRNSEYLIVICTEALKDSKWCKDEIEFFKELHNGSTDKIIAVVASGKPEDVVPEILRTRKISP